MKRLKTKKVAWLGKMLRVRKDALGGKLYARIRGSLTLRKREFGGENTEKKAYMENNTFVWLPRWFGKRVLAREGFEIVDKRVDGAAVDMEFTAQLGVPPFPSQQPKLVEAVVNGVRQNGFGGFGVAPCGTGKTVMGAAIAAAFGRSTLVIVHRAHLLKQWEEAFESFTRVGGKRVRTGLVRSNSCDYGPRFPVSVGMLKSLAERDYPEEFYSSWGLILIDEVHHIPARTWLEAVAKFDGRYFVGLTATLRRKDGLQPIFDYTLGPVFYRLTRDQIQAEAVFYPLYFLGSTDYLYTAGMLNRTLVEKRLANLESRNRLIAEEITKAVEQGRKRIMVFSGTRIHLANIFDQLAPKMQNKAGFYIGARKDEELEKVKGKRIILATYQMGDEGLDIQDIDTVMLATPRPDVEQPVGRAFRFYVEKRAPIIVDFVDCLIGLVKWGERRRLQYLRMGVTVKNQLPTARR